MEAVRFARDSSRLTPEARTALKALAKEMKTERGTRLKITAHTDARGKPSHNLRLSLDRARAVKSFLKSRRVAGSRIQVEGKGDAEPVADNATEEGRARNRRVEFTFIPAR
jgi:outer membrane protein OmpA-like peptidoglycan-associated protein